MDETEIDYEYSIPQATADRLADEGEVFLKDGNGAVIKLEVSE